MTSQNKVEQLRQIQELQQQLEEKVQLKMKHKQKKVEVRQSLLQQLQKEQQIRDELREACQADKSLRDEQAAREELQETLARETAHHRALQKQVYVGCTDWTGKGKNWGPKQQAEQQTYRLGPGDVLEEEAKTAIELQLLKLPTAFGGMRYATLALLPDGNRMVVKRILKEGIKLERNRKVLEADVRCMCIANRIADAFNQALAKSNLPKCFKEAQITFSTPSIVVIPDDEAACGKAVYLMEPHLAGTWAKWLQNDGSTLTGRQLPALLEAFVHFSYSSTRQEAFFDGGLMVLDLQGCLVYKTTPESVCACFTLTDPSISTAAADPSLHFGETNHSMEAIHRFMHAHQCSEICEALDLNQADAVSPSS